MVSRFLLIMTLFFSLVPVGRAATTMDSLPGMEEKMDLLLSTLGNKTQAPREDVIDAVGRVIDFPAITLGVLGTHRTSLSEVQTQRFRVEFEQSITNLLQTALTALDSYELDFKDVKMKSETRAQIFAVVTTAENERFEILSSVAAKDNEWKIRNLIINGVNLGLTYRNQFSELMKTHKNNIDNVITAWSETITDASKRSAEK